MAAAIFYYTSQGCAVSMPLTDNTRYDIIVDDGERLVRVQCKSTGYRTPHGVYEAALQTSGGNKSGTGKQSRITEKDCEAVFVYRLDGVMYHFPVEHVTGRKSINLGKLQTGFIVSPTYGSQALEVGALV